MQSAVREFSSNKIEGKKLINKKEKDYWINRLQRKKGCYEKKGRKKKKGGEMRKGKKRRPLSGPDKLWGGGGGRETKRRESLRGL